MRGILILGGFWLMLAMGLPMTMVIGLTAIMVIGALLS